MTFEGDLAGTVKESGNPAKVAWSLLLPGRSCGRRLRGVKARMEQKHAYPRRLGRLFPDGTGRFGEPGFRFVRPVGRDPGNSCLFIVGQDCKVCRSRHATIRGSDFRRPSQRPGRSVFSDQELIDRQSRVDRSARASFLKSRFSGNVRGRSKAP